MNHWGLISTSYKAKEHEVLDEIPAAEHHVMELTEQLRVLAQNTVMEP